MKIENLITEKQTLKSRLQIQLNSTSELILQLEQQVETIKTQIAECDEYISKLTEVNATDVMLAQKNLVKS